MLLVFDRYIGFLLREGGGVFCHQVADYGCEM